MNALQPTMNALQPPMNALQAYILCVQHLGYDFPNELKIRIYSFDLKIYSICPLDVPIYLKKNRGNVLITGNIQQILDGEIFVSIEFQNKKCKLKCSSLTILLTLIRSY